VWLFQNDSGPIFFQAGFTKKIEAIDFFKVSANPKASFPTNNEEKVPVNAFYNKTRGVSSCSLMSTALGKSMRRPSPYLILSPLRRPRWSIRSIVPSGRP
jgi:hypothetical protein